VLLRRCPGQIWSAASSNARSRPGLDLSAGKLITDCRGWWCDRCCRRRWRWQCGKGIAQAWEGIRQGIIQAGVGSISKTIAAQTGQQIIKESFGCMVLAQRTNFLFRGTIDTVSSSKSHPPETDFEDLDVDEKLVERITQEQTTRHAMWRIMPNPFRTTLSSKWPDLVALQQECKSAICYSTSCRLCLYDQAR